MQTICTSVQTDNHASTPALRFYRQDALPAAQPTASKHLKQQALKATALKQLLTGLLLCKNKQHMKNFSYPIDVGVSKRTKA